MNPIQKLGVHTLYALTWKKVPPKKLNRKPDWSRQPKHMRPSKAVDIDPAEYNGSAG